MSLAKKAPRRPSSTAHPQPAGAAITKREFERLAAFRHTLRQFLHFSETAALAAGIKPQQHQALLAIVGYPGREEVTIGELSERLQIAHHSAVGLANRLVAGRLVERRAGTEDARQVYLCVTPRGRQLLERLTAAHQAELQRLGPTLSALLQDLKDNQVTKKGG